MKKINGIDDALRQIAKQRDKLLGKVALSPARRAVLTDFLGGEFPVEAAFRETATRRDELLNPQSREIPASVESILRRQLGDAEAERIGVRGDLFSFPRWLRPFRWGRIATVCALFAAAFLCVGIWVTPARRGVEKFSHAPRPNLKSQAILEAELFTQKVASGPFNLNTNEPASLQASFFANSSAYLAKASEAPLGLRLDLPVKVILTDDSLARTP